MVPKIVRLLVRTFWTGAAWVTDTFISYCEFVIRSAVRTGLAVLIAMALIRASVWFDSNPLLLLGVAIGGLGLLYLAFATSPIRLGAAFIGKLSSEAQFEIERLSNILFLLVVTMFYLSIDQGQKHPTLLKVFLSIMVVLFFAACVPGRSRLVGWFQRRFQVLVLVPIIVMAIVGATPEAITNRIINSHGLERATGTVARAIPYKVNDQDRLVNATTGEPIAFFSPIGKKDANEPTPIIGWTKKKDAYFLYPWFEGQSNWNDVGQMIEPITPGKIDEIIYQEKRKAERAEAEAQKLKDDVVAQAKREQDQKDLAAAKTAAQEAAERKKAEQRPATSAVPAVTAMPVLTARTPTTFTVRTFTPEEGSGLPQGTVPARLESPISYLGRDFPEQTVVAFNIRDLKGEKGDIAVLYPQFLFLDKKRYPISGASEVELPLTERSTVKDKFKKITGGAIVGGILGGITGGKKGVAIGAGVGAAAGAVYAVMFKGKQVDIPVDRPITLTLR